MKNLHIYATFVNTVLYFASSDDDLQRSVHLLHEIVSKYNFVMSISEPKVYGFIRDEQRSAKIVVNDMSLELILLSGM